LKNEKERPDTEGRKEKNSVRERSEGGKPRGRDKEELSNLRQPGLAFREKGPSDRKRRRGGVFSIKKK